MTAAADAAAAIWMNSLREKLFFISTSGYLLYLSSPDHRSPPYGSSSVGAVFYQIFNPADAALIMVPEITS
jgi:hypothetical protein